MCSSSRQAREEAILPGIHRVSAMANEELLDKIQGLSDMELAVLLCLTAQEHCIIDTEPDALDDLVLELQLVGQAIPSRLC